MYYQMSSSPFGKVSGLMGEKYYSTINTTLVRWEQPFHEKVIVIEFRVRLVGVVEK